MLKTRNTRAHVRGKCEGAKENEADLAQRWSSGSQVSRFRVAGMPKSWESTRRPSSTVEQWFCNFLRSILANDK